MIMMHHPRGYGSFAKIIEEYVQKRNLFPLGEAIRKMTSLPAETIGIMDRGRLASGYKADILIFDPSSVKALATFSEPHQLAKGFEYVLLNGKLVLSQGIFTGSRHGRMLRKQ